MEHQPLISPFLESKVDREFNQHHVHCFNDYFGKIRGNTPLPPTFVYIKQISVTRTKRQTSNQPLWKVSPLPLSTNICPSVSEQFLWMRRQFSGPVPLYW